MDKAGNETEPQIAASTDAEEIDLGAVSDDEWNVVFRIATGSVVDYSYSTPTSVRLISIRE